MTRIASWLLGLAAVGCAGWAVAAYLAPPPPADTGPWYRVETTEQDLGPVPPGVRRVPFRITNVSDRPRRVVGGSGQCVRNVCIKPEIDTQVEIPPGETVEFACELSISRPGPIEAAMSLYMDDGGIQEVRLTVRGEAVAPEGRADAPKP